MSGETEHWKLALTPKSKQAGKYLHDIVIQGSQAEPRCIVVTQTNDQASFMLVGDATEASLPSPLARDWLTNFCAAKP